jgi:hypothetical protein
MPSFEEIINTLSPLFELEAQLEQQRVNMLSNVRLLKALRDEQDEAMQKQIVELGRYKYKALGDLVAFPPHHIRHFQELAIFHDNKPFEKSVFIMTKFPEGDTALAQELRRVITAVQTAIQGCNYIPRIASDFNYHPILWDNVELYLLGCGSGVAIVESKYRPELNPNVAMEWGWMRGMGKNVLYLLEESFSQQRADWSGLSEERFPWVSPEDAIKKAIEKWLGAPG